MEDKTNLVAQVFDSQAKSWNNKKQYVTYYGAYSNIKNEVCNNVADGMNIADIGCGTGKLLLRIDKLIHNSKLLGLDLSKKMILEAKQKVYSNNNLVNFVNNNFLTYNFSEVFDMIIFSYVLHHIDNPVDALKKAKHLLSNNGKIIFSVPGKSYLSEIFDDDNLVGRYDFNKIDNIINVSGLFPLISTRNCFKMKFESFEVFINYLKSIGTYQKIIGYSNNSWNKDIFEQTLEKYKQLNFISGEYLTYTCVDKDKMLIKK